MKSPESNIEELRPQTGFIRRFGRMVAGAGAMIGSCVALAGCGTESHSSAATQDCEITTSQSSESSGEFSTSPAWEQDFCTMQDGPIDTKVWRYEDDPAVPGYNNEQQAYTVSQDNVRIENGSLILEARRQHYTYPGTKLRYNITSGRIDTRNSFSFEYGKFTATMKLPKGSGTWPAFWFLSANQPYTSELNPTQKDWEQPGFYRHDGELDAVEGYGNRPGYIEGTAHTFEQSRGGNTIIRDASEDFHTYGVELTPKKIVWTVDGKPYAKFDKPSDNPDQWPFGNGNRLYPILNLAMSDYYAGNIGDEAKSWRLVVKDVSYYPLASDEAQK